jgi:NADH-quinone oxidoreductase subunit H
LLQPLADGVKFLFKEDLTPPHVYKPLYIAAPMIAVVFALTSIAVVPFGNWIKIGSLHIPLQITDVNIGLLIILGVTSLGVYGVALAGWSSNSKYSLLGGLRASAQMISYEISLGLSLVGVLILAGSLSLRDIVDAQSGVFWGFIPKWNIFYGTVHRFLYLLMARMRKPIIPFGCPAKRTVAGYRNRAKFAVFLQSTPAITVAAGILLFRG